MGVESTSITLNTINSGAAKELFDEAFKKILENIADENTKAKATRSIMLKISVTPSDDRGQATTTVEVKTSLAPIKPHSGTMLFSFNGTRVEAFAVSNPKQPSLPGLNDPEVFQKSANGERI